MQEPGELYNSIGVGYNTMRMADPYLSERLYSLLNPLPGGLYLDIGCGTGNYTVKLAEKGVNICGVEPSEQMLQEALKKGTQVQWYKGSSDNIPFDDHIFDGIVATLTIHHWKDIERSFHELYRVLKPRGRMVLFTSWPVQMDGYWLNHYFPQMMKVSAGNMPSLEKLSSACEKAGFRVNTIENYSVKEDLEDLFLYAGKDHPEIYFDEEYRRGISSFAAFANKEEVEEGLKKLRKDIDSGAFFKIRQQYENELGDYVFVVIGV